MFGKVVEIAGEDLRTDSLVYIEGKLQTREWENDGIKRYTTEIIPRESGQTSTWAFSTREQAGLKVTVLRVSVDTTRREDWILDQIDHSIWFHATTGGIHGST